MNRITINTHRTIGTINRNIYGHFSEHLGRCIYQGLYVGEDSPIPNVNGMRTDVVEALRHIKVPVLRWPGGCFADEYHWRDGIGPREDRKRMVNTHWGNVVEDNSFGTHEFIELCRQIGCEPYVNGNLGSGTVREMSEWVEYMNSASDSSVAQERWANGANEPFGVKYFGVGNENWGCGGNMRPEYYADEYRRYQTYCRNYGDNKLYKIACGANAADYRWTDVMMERAAQYMDALTVHYYTGTGEWPKKSSATEFTLDEYHTVLRNALRMGEIVDGHLQIMHRYDPQHRVGLIVDEWGTWHHVEPGTNPGFLYQQNTMRDALVASLTLDIFNARCDRIVMANLAQTVNVLQAVILTEGDKMVLTPTYHVFDLYKAHQDAEAVDIHIDSKSMACDGVPQLSGSASMKDGALTLTLSNASADASTTIDVALLGFDAKSAAGRVLSGATDAYNDFNRPQFGIVPLGGVALNDGVLSIKMPACSVAEITCK